jgi:hypothetical protein
VREGDNVSLSCEASGYPPPHIVWRREDGDDILIGGRKVTRRYPPLRKANYTVYSSNDWYLGEGSAEAG